jgi:hypothetical protein
MKIYFVMPQETCIQLRPMDSTEAHILFVPEQVSMRQIHVLFDLLGQNPELPETVYTPKDAGVRALLAPRHHNIHRGSAQGFDGRIQAETIKKDGVRVHAPDPLSALFRVNQLLHEHRDQPIENIADVASHVIQIHRDGLPRKLVVGVDEENALIVDETNQPMFGKGFLEPDTTEIAI